MSTTDQPESRETLPRDPERAPAEAAERER